MKRLVALLLVLGSLAIGSVASAGGRALALVGAKVYTSPEAAPIDDGVVVVRDGKIAAVGRRRDVRVPKDAEVIDCAGLVVAAGFWNCHVHFSDPSWMGAGELPAERLTAKTRDMLTKYGFTTVFDIGSQLENTVALRRRIEAGQVEGPAILTAGPPMYPKNGTPFYLLQFFKDLGVTPPEIGTKEEALAGARERLAGGADAIKIFTASPVVGGKTVAMSPDAIRAVTAEAHRHGKLVFAHPQSAEGVNNAIDCGVDILAHAAPEMGPWDAGLIARMKRANVSLIPTLKLWRAGLIQEGTPADEAVAFQAVGVEQLRAFAAANGRVLFGTDVGYVADFDTTEEFEQMARAGMDYRQILTSLTTAPAARFGARTKGTIARGKDADLVVLASDPASGARAFSSVRYTIRAGRVIFGR